MGLKNYNIRTDKDFLGCYLGRRNPSFWCFLGQIYWLFRLVCLEIRPAVSPLFLCSSNLIAQLSITGGPLPFCIFPIAAWDAQNPCFGVLLVRSAGFWFQQPSTTSTGVGPCCYFNLTWLILSLSTVRTVFAWFLLQICYWDDCAWVYCLLLDYICLYTPLIWLLLHYCHRTYLPFLSARLPPLLVADGTHISVFFHLSGCKLVCSNPHHFIGGFVSTWPI